RTAARLTATQGEETLAHAHGSETRSHVSRHYRAETMRERWADGLNSLLGLPTLAGVTPFLPLRRRFRRGRGRNDVRPNCPVGSELFVNRQAPRNEWMRAKYVVGADRYL